MSVVQLTEAESGSAVKSSKVQWTWASPDAPLRINIALKVIARLRAELEQTSSLGEAGGLLLGYASKTPATLDIQDYALLPPDRDSAGNYCLDVAQLERLRHKRSDLVVVGYFRTQPDGALHLRRPEVNLISDHFNHQTDVVLLIRTDPHQFKAGFLFWDGDAFVPFSVHDFPFDAGLLAQEETEAHKLAFVPRLESQPTAFRTPLIDELPPRKPTHVRRNVLAACIGVAAVIGLSPLLLREGVHGPSKSTVSKSAPAAAQPADRPTATTPVSPAPKNLVVPPLVRAPLPSAAQSIFAASHQRLPLPPPPTPVSLSRSPAAAASPTPAPDRQIPATVDVAPPLQTPQAAASAPAAEPAPPPPPVPAASAPAIATREQPATPANPPAAIPPTVSAPPPKEAARPAAPAAPSHFAGGWSYPLNNGLYHGSQPEIVEVSIQEVNGRLSGTAYARFKAPNEPARTLRFQFAGDVRPGRIQSFNIETVDGAKGSIDLIPGTSPNLLELNFRTMSDGGNGQTGNMILVKR